MNERIDVDTDPEEVREGDTDGMIGRKGGATPALAYGDPNAYQVYGPAGRPVDHGTRNLWLAMVAAAVIVVGFLMLILPSLRVPDVNPSARAREGIYHPFTGFDNNPTPMASVAPPQAR